MSKSSLFLVVLSTLLTVYAVEGFLALSGSAPYHKHTPITQKRMQLASEQGTVFDRRTLSEFVQENREQGIAMVPRISPRIGLSTSGYIQGDGSLFALAGLANRRTAYCNAEGDYLVFQSDRYGLRNADEVYGQGEFDVVLVGDSFAMGHCVERDMGALLRGRGISTVNLGYGGNGPLIELATLREYGSMLTPRHVLWVYFEGNDLRDLGREMGAEVLSNYLNENFNQNLIARQHQIDTQLESYLDRVLVTPGEPGKPGALKRILFLDGIRNLMHRAMRRNDIADQQFELFAQILERARADVETWGGQLHFVYLPQWERFSGVNTRSSLSVHHDRILAIAGELSLPVIDLTPVIAAQPDPLELFPFRLKGHFTQEGYKLVAGEIVQHLLAQSNHRLGSQTGLSR